VEARSSRTAEGTTPFELCQAGRLSRCKADRRAGRLLQAAGHRLPAAGAKSDVILATARAARRQEEIQHSLHAAKGGRRH
jgi:hypothetical protein